MSRLVTGCGIKCQPPSLLIKYKFNYKTKVHVIRLHEFPSSVSVLELYDNLIKKNRHKYFLEQVPKIQLIRLLSILKSVINGQSLEDSLRINAALECISSNEDLNKADDETLERKKLVMEETFERNRIRPTDPDFEYDIEVDFPKQIETSGWDSDFSDF
ncbi:unnamed protein product [Schistocephalus solidus]|uniref:Centrosomal protein of 19 kDa n=1 Tax=Schistocephalus solidus TaxID=70667 RepID=A0A183TKX2_SCHSO|nr:unnamed protein product [Schistocephalus solidus]